MESKKEENEIKNTKEKENEISVSKLLILYDEFQFSYEVAKEKLEKIFEAIESHNNPKEKSPKNFYHNKKLSQIRLENKYYTCDILYEINSFNKIEEIDLSKYEGILLFFEETSIKNKIFMDKSSHFKDEYNFSSCIIIFEEEQEELQNLDLFDQFIGETIDKHFEVIYDCQNLKNFNQDDGIGAINLSLHSTQWRGGQDTKKNQEGVEKNKNEIKEIVDKDDKKFYQELKDNEEIEKVFGKIKEIKKLNMDPNISLEDKRNNAEKAVMMLVNMLGLEDEGEEDEEEKEINENKNKDKNIENKKEK